jgi:hypothetical protein
VLVFGWRCARRGDDSPSTMRDDSAGTIYLGVSLLGSYRFEPNEEVRHGNKLTNSSWRV